VKDAELEQYHYVECVMALIECAECGKQVSDKATACPNCGFPPGNISLGVGKIELNEIPDSVAIVSCENAGLVNQLTCVSNDNNDNKLKVSLDSIAENSSNQTNMPATGAPWGGGLVSVFAIITIFMPIIGIIIGLYGVFHESKRLQGVLLILESIVVYIFYIVFGLIHGFLEFLLS